MNLIALIGCFLLGFWIIYKIIPSQRQSNPREKPSAFELDRPWYEVLELNPQASDKEIESKYQEMTAIYEEANLRTLDAKEQEEARSIRNQIEAAYHFSKFRRTRS